MAKDPVHIPDLIEQIENNYKSSHNDLDIKLVFEVSENIPEFALGDDVRLIQIVTNLINNSIKFTPRGSVTTVVGNGIQSLGNPPTDLEKDWVVLVKKTQ